MVAPLGRTDAPKITLRTFGVPASTRGVGRPLVSSQFHGEYHQRHRTGGTGKRRQLLRYCIGQANSTPGADTITFDSTVFATPKTITPRVERVTRTHGA